MKAGCFIRITKKNFVTPLERLLSNFFHVVTIMHIDILFDPQKDAANVNRHGMSLERTREIAWREVMCHADARRDYGEVREVGFVPIEGKVHCVVFTQRGGALRIISLRRANNRENERYERSIVQVLPQYAGRGGGDRTGHSDGPRHLRPFRRVVRTDETVGGSSAE
ncbi:BrnT family toxin [Caballeronia sp. HLA56]